MNLSVNRVTGDLWVNLTFNTVPNGCSQFFFQQMEEMSSPGVCRIGADSVA